MKYTGKVGAKGQVTIRLQIRRRLGVRQGDRVEFVPQGELTIIRPTQETANPFARSAGALGAFPGGVNETNAWIEDLRSPGKTRMRTR